MFGNNPIRKFENSDGSVLKIQEIFKTFQGEAIYAGTPSVFVRLGGCNLSCIFCDTEFESFEEKTLEEIIDKIYYEIGNSKINLIVITGGEPFRQNISPLCDILINKNFKVQIESNGMLFFPINEKVEIICSPKISNKKYFKVRDDFDSRVAAYKFLISKYLDAYSNVPEWNFRNKIVYVQPMDEYSEEKNNENLELAKKIALEKGFKLSIQIHKLIGVK